MNNKTKDAFIHWGVIQKHFTIYTDLEVYVIAFNHVYQENTGFKIMSIL